MTTASSPPPSDPTPHRPAPPSLRRHAPARVELTDDEGRPLRMTDKYVHVRAGSKVRVKVVPQIPRAGEPPADVTISLSNSLRWVDPPHPVADGLTTCQTGVAQSRRWGKLPVPKRADVFVSTAPPGVEKVRLSVALVVWPSWWSVLGWGFSGVALVLFTTRIQEVSKTLAPFEAIVRTLADFTFLGQTALLGGGLSALIHAASWGLVWLGFVAPDAE